MDNEAFEERLKVFLETTPDIFVTLPEGLVLYSITPVVPSAWIAGFVSARGGRWNLDGHPAKYFADNISTCLAELIGSCEEDIESCVCESWQTTGSLRALDIGKFPHDLQRAFFEQGGLPAEKWWSCHTLLRNLRFYPECSTARAIKALSPYGQALGIPGFVLAANPLDHPFEMVDHHTIGIEMNMERATV